MPSFDVATLENSLTGPENVKHRVTYDPEIPQIIIYPRERKHTFHKVLYTPVHRHVIHKSQKSGSNPNVHPVMDKQNVMYNTMEYSSALKRNEMLIPATTLMNR